MANSSPLPLTLPRLHVPDLHSTLTKYLASLEPFLLEDNVSYASNKRQRAKWAAEFKQGIGKILQARLLALNKTSPYNWLGDNFWIDVAYLTRCEPLLVHSNYWVVLEDEPALDQLQHGEKLDAHFDFAVDNFTSRAGTTKRQIQRAARLLYRMLHFRDRIESGELYPPMTPKGIWVRESISKMFNFARIPHAQRDTFSTPDPASPHHHCVLVMLYNWCYAVRVYNTHQQLFSALEIEMRLHAVVRDVEARLGKGERAVPVGVLSADGRDRWAENLEYLYTLSPINQQSHQAMLDSIMCLSLDSCVPDSLTVPTPSSTASSSSTSLVPRTSLTPASSTTLVPTPGAILIPSPASAATHLQATRSLPSNVANRFFDKPFTLLVDAHGRAGGMGEHSACDALVPSMMAEWAVEEDSDDGDPMRTGEGEKDFMFGKCGEAGESNDWCWERLDWRVDDKMVRECLAAEERACFIIADSDYDVLPFEGYGTSWIKSVAHLSPDAFIQMVLQLAWYQTHGTFTATYETVLTRMFQHGRTETVRTLTRESKEWVLSMEDPEASPITRHFLLHRAIHTHARLTREAATGRGVDRHFLGLQLLLRSEDGEQLPALLTDPLFTHSANWRLCTSALGTGKNFKGTGFGAVREDGYGINYLSGPDMLKFGVESKFSCATTSTSALSEAIVKSLEEMRDICLAPYRGDVGSKMYRAYLYLYTKALYLREKIVYLLF